MQDVNVVIVFYSRTGATERKALAAAVGGVEGRGFIRLRRIAETASEEAMAAVPGWKETHERMNREYIAPREVDHLWADGLVICIPDWMDLSAPEVTAYLDTLAALGQLGKLEGKFAAAPERKALEDALARVGLITVPAVSGADALERARLHGFGVAEAARAATRSRASSEAG